MRTENHKQSGNDNKQRPELAPSIILQKAKIIEQKDNAYNQHPHARQDPTIPKRVAVVKVSVFIIVFIHSGKYSRPFRCGGTCRRPAKMTRGRAVQPV